MSSELPSHDKAGGMSKRLFFIGVIIVLVVGGVSAIVLAVVTTAGPSPTVLRRENGMKQLVILYEMYTHIRGHPPKSWEELSSLADEYKLPPEIIDAFSNGLIRLRWGERLTVLSPPPVPDVVAVLADPAIGEKLVIFGSDCKVRTVSRQEYVEIAGPKPELPVGK